MRIAALLLVFTALALLAAVSYAPRADEGFFASPGLNLATHGHMGTTILEGSHEFMKNIHRYTYWITPLHFVAQAAWYKLVGFSLLKMRLLSLLFALLALGAWYLLIKRIAGDARVALATATLIAFDFNFVVGASSGRMDMMAAALGVSGIAAYVRLRERSLAWALLAGNAFAAAAGLTHPVAGYLYGFGQVFLALYFDRRRLSPGLVALAAIPYLIGGAAWGAYILNDSEAFRAQFGTNATMGGRLNGLKDPLAALWREITWRHFAGYGLGGGSSTGVSGPVFLKALALFLYLLGVAGAVLTRELRTHRGYRALLLLAGIHFLALAILDSQKAYYYLPHLAPLYAALTVGWLAHVVRRGAVPAWLPAAAVAAIVLVQAAGIAYRGYLNPYRRAYAPVIAFLKQAAGPGDLVFGNASLGFGYGFERNLTDDVRLGYYTGKKPDLVVLDQEYLWAIRRYRASQPEIYRFIEKRLAGEYETVYDHGGYQVLMSRERLARASSRVM